MNAINTILESKQHYTKFYFHDYNRSLYKEMGLTVADDSIGRRFLFDFIEIVAEKKAILYYVQYRPNVIIDTIFLVPRTKHTNIP